MNKKRREKAALRAGRFAREAAAAQAVNAEPWEPLPGMLKRLPEMPLLVCSVSGDRALSRSTRTCARCRALARIAAIGKSGWSGVTAPPGASMHRDGGQPVKPRHASRPPSQNPSTPFVLIAPLSNPVTNVTDQPARPGAPQHLRLSPPCPPEPLPAPREGGARWRGDLILDVVQLTEGLTYPLI
jgi:hypothetical protein